MECCCDWLQVRCPLFGLVHSAAWTWSRSGVGDVTVNTDTLGSFPAARGFSRVTPITAALFVVVPFQPC